MALLLSFKYREIILHEQQARAHLEPTQEAGREFFTRGIQGPIVMLNLMRFRTVADYSQASHLSPAAPISGEAAYKLYMDHTLPFLSDKDHLAGMGHRTAALEDSRLLPLVES